MKMESFKEKLQREPKVALVILLLACILCCCLSMYALYNIQDVQVRCSEYYIEQMKEMNCIDVFNDSEPFINGFIDMEDLNEIYINNDNT